MARPDDSLLGRALQTSIQLAADSAGQPVAEQPWAAQLARGLQHIGVPSQPEQRERIELAGVRRAALQWHLDRVDAATDGHSRLRHYFRQVRPECLDPDSCGLPAYVSEVRGRQRRRALAELRTGIHWGA